jgi:hypothetical protein
LSAPNWLSSRYDLNLAYVTATDKVEYVGSAEPGATKAEAKWAIYKVLYSGDNVTELRWANADRKFDKVWNDRATYTYDVT